VYKYSTQWRFISRDSQQQRATIYSTISEYNYVGFSPQCDLSSPGATWALVNTVSICSATMYTYNMSLKLANNVVCHTKFYNDLRLMKDAGID